MLENITRFRRKKSIFPTLYLYLLNFEKKKRKKEIFLFYARRADDFSCGLRFSLTRGFRNDSKALNRISENKDNTI